MVAQRLRDLPLRSQTGASVVAIERSGERLINPGPDEVLRAGDRVLLLGHTEQLPQARAWLLRHAQKDGAVLAVGSPANKKPEDCSSGFFMN